MPHPTPARPRIALGLMSGTSLDGIDAALVETDGADVVRPLGAVTEPYEAAFRERLRGCLGEVGPVAEVEEELTRLHAAAVARLLAAVGVPADEVDVIGFHGHTVLHAPQERLTRQIGDGALLARLTGIDVVYDLRSADVAAGGEGAPLAPVLHRALAAGLERPLAVLNVGGVANLTWIGPDEALIAFDTGPGNTPIDEWAARHGQGDCDLDGRLARAGRADEGVLAQLLAADYFRRPPPKSLDRLDFRPAEGLDLAPADGAATLTAFTAAAVAAALPHLPAPPRRWLVTGGGRRNPALMAELAARLEAPVEPIEAIGADGDALEAQLFAYLAVRSLDGLPISFPGTTGAPRPLSGGRLARAVGR